jgi:hypothetical protein
LPIHKVSIDLGRLRNAKSVQEIYGFNLKMPKVTFDEFKSYFEFGIEIVGVSGGLLTLLYKIDVIKSFYKITRGRARSGDSTVAVEALQQGGAVAHQVANHGHGREAGRLEAIRREASRSPSPGAMV